MGQVSYVRVPSDKMSPERLDIGFYSKEYFEALSILESSNINTVEIGDVTEPWCFGAYALCNSIVWSNSNEGLPYIKAEALGSPLINFDGLTYITKGTHKLLTKSQLKAGDIIVSTSGTIGLCAVIPDSIEIANSNQDTIKFNPSKKGFDNYFVVAWIASRYGQIILKREAGGAIQQHIYLSNFRRIPLLNPDRLVQNYIGDKVRLAEKLRELSKQANNKISKIFADFNYLEFPKGKTSRIQAKDLLDSLNPNAYLPRFLKADKIIKSYRYKSIKSISLDIADGPFGSNLKVTDYRTGNKAVHPVIRVKNCVNGELDKDDLVWIDSKKQKELSRSEVKANDLLVTKAGRIGSTAVYPDDLPPGNITSHLIRARLKPNIDVNYVAEFLETKVGLALTARHSFKSTRPELTKGEIESCHIVLLDEGQMAQVGKLARLRNICSCYTLLLAIAAKYLVEALIEGKLTETELKNAQTALQKGDIEPDKAILAKLTRQGYDIPDQPALFPDLDAIYEATKEINLTSDS